MCGIAGYIGKKRIDELPLRRTLELMKKRGPDHQGCIRFDEGSFQVVLAHSRLSIIDLEARSNQPFIVGDYTLVFNGEIYNYQELRQGLEKRGVRFLTESDTEVLLQSYIVYGEACVEQFEGMWSFAIYDKKKKNLFVSRDRFAEKPLYFLKTQDGLFFGSEVKLIKSLSQETLPINQQQMARYLVNGYKSLYKTSDTFFIDIQELPYATNMVVDSNLVPSFRRYWQPAFEPRPMSLQEAIEGFRHRLIESMRLRLRADVPLTFCLSGGVDSAALVSIAAKHFHYDVKTFTIIDPDERYNEYTNAKATIDDIGCRHTIVEIGRGETFSRLRKLIEYHDAPLLTISYYVHSFLSEAIAGQGYRVVCSGTGLDEELTGYYDHFNLYLYEMRSQPRYAQYLNDWKKHVSGFVRNPYLKKPELYFDDPSIRDHIYLNNDIFARCLKREFREPFAEKKFCDSLLRNRMMNEMFHESVPVILHEDDLNSMFYSIENRSPYLDRSLFEFACSIPGEYLIQNGYAKYILREAVKGILNDKVRLDRQKKGFNASINSLIDFTDKKSRETILEDSPIYTIVRRDKIEEMLNPKVPLPNSTSKFLFNFINAKIFLELNG